MGPSPSTPQMSLEQRLKPHPESGASAKFATSEAAPSATPVDLSLLIVGAGPLVDRLEPLAAGLGHLAIIEPARSAGLLPPSDAILLPIEPVNSQTLKALGALVRQAEGTPVIAIGLDDELTALDAAVAAGADDYCKLSDLSPKTLLRAINGAAARARAAAPGAVTLIQESADAMVILDRDGVVRFANEEAATLLDAPADKLIGQAFPYPVSLAYAEFSLPQEAGLDRIAEARMIDTDWGGLPARLVSLSDITVRRRLEATIDRAASATTAQNNFISGVSHELRTPLTDIIGFSDLIREQRFGPILNDRYRDYVEDINASGKRLLDMVDDLLGVTNAQSSAQGGGSLADEICDIAELVQLTARSQLAGTITDDGAKPNQVQIIVACEEALPGLRGDAARLRQALAKVIADAVETATGPTDLRIACSRHNDSIAVDITGGWRGLTEEDLTTALSDQLAGGADPFVINPRLMRLARTGAALRNMKRAADLHGGKFTLQTEGDDGLALRLTLPIAKS